MERVYVSTNLRTEKDLSQETLVMGTVAASVNSLQRQINPFSSFFSFFKASVRVFI